MFEGLLSSVLSGYLDKYISNFDKKSLQLSVWSGKIELTNLLLKKDIFQEQKLPLQLIVGRLGKLSIKVPWTSLGSTPVDVVIEDLHIVVKPITDQSKWVLADSSNDLSVKEMAIHTLTYAAYEEMIKTKEELEKQAGMMKGLITKIIDNLQVKIANIHVRVENEDIEDPLNNYSLGITLRQLVFYTTDQHWTKTFVDRTAAENKDLPLFKLLNIDNFAVYYKINETYLIHKKAEETQLNEIQKLTSQSQSQSFLEKEGDRIPRYLDDYLLEPIHLKVNMEQYDPQQALQKLTSSLNLKVHLAQLGICLQKRQYDNLQRLLELTNDYMGFCNTEVLKKKKQDLSNMNSVMISEKKVTDGVVKRKIVKQTFTKIYRSQFEIVIKYTLDEKKRDQLLKELQSNLEKSGEEKVYKAILAAMDQADLQSWAKQEAQILAEVYKQNKQKSQQKQGWGSYFGWGSSAQEDKPTESENELIQKLEKQIQQQFEDEKSLCQGEKAKSMQLIPKTCLNFKLDQFKISLIDENGNGITNYSNDFKVKLLLFDSDNKYNKHSMELQLEILKFGLDVISKQEGQIPFMYQLQPSQNALRLNLATGNVNNQQSDLPKEMISTIDLDLDMHLTPIEVIYQARPIESLGKFFTVKNMNDHAKIAAQEQFNLLANQVNQVSKSIEGTMKKNKIKVLIEAPRFILPFNQQSLPEIEQSECWVFTLGQLIFQSAVDNKYQQIQFFETYEVQLHNIKFDFVDKYILLKTHKAQITPVLQDFNTTAVLIKKRDVDEMKDQKSKNALRDLKSPDTEVIASFDSNILLQLKPKIFIKLCQLSDLLVTEKTSDQFYLDRIHQTMQKSHLSAKIKKQSIYMQFVQGTGCLIKPGSLFFFEDGDIYSLYEFSLDGILQKGGIVLDGLEIQLINRDQVECKLQLATMSLAKRWESELIQLANELEKMKLNVKESVIELEDDENTQSNVIAVPKNNVLDDEESDKLKLVFRFQSPKISLQLLTDTKNKNQRAADEKWNLLTEMSEMSCRYVQSTFETQLDVSICQLKVTDNSGDDRFPSIFENQPSDGQKELVTISQRVLNEKSPQYLVTKVKNKLDIGFGGMVMNWKPQCFIYLVQFLNTQVENAKNEKKAQEESEENVIELNLQVEDSLQRQTTADEALSSKTMKTCIEKPGTELKLNLSLSFMKAVFIHPDNHTYPIFTIRLQTLKLGYDKLADHDDIGLKIKNFQIYDNLNYPHTLDPYKEYAADEPLIEKEIMGVKVASQNNQVNMLDIKLIMFQYPGKEGCCPHQKDKQYNMIVDIDMKKLMLNYMQEQTMRMVDYYFYQIMRLLQYNTSSSDQKSATIIRNEAKKVALNKQGSYQNFDLEQTVQGPKLNIFIESPLIKIPDLRKGDSYFEMDFGTIEVSSCVEQEKGRWIHFPDQLIWVTRYLIYNRQMSLVYKTEKEVDYIFKSDLVEVIVTMVNPSPYLIEPEQKVVVREDDDDDAAADENKPKQQLRTVLVNKILGMCEKDFDLSQVDQSMVTVVNLNIFKMLLHQATFISLFDILANNVGFLDQYSKEFKQRLVVQADEVAVKKAETSIKLKPERKTMELIIKSHCLSMEMRDFEAQLVCELVIVAFEYAQISYLNGKSIMRVLAGTMLIFHNEYFPNGPKEVMMGHIHCVSEVQTDAKDFYEKMVEELEKEMAENNRLGFKYEQIYEANGDSDMLIALDRIMIYMRQEVFINMSKFLISGLSRMQKNPNDSNLNQENDAVKQEEVLNEKFVSDATYKMRVDMNDTVLIMENNEMLSRCIALRISSKILMKSMDKDFVRSTLDKESPQRIWSLTDVQVPSIAMFFAKTEDLQRSGVIEAEKRDILQPMQMQWLQEIYLRYDFPLQYVNDSVMKFSCNDIVMKLSIEDVYTISAVSTKQQEDLWKLLGLWNDHNAKNKPQSDEQAKLQAKKTEDIELSSMNVKAQEIEVVIINEKDGGFVPMFFTKVDRIAFTQQSDSGTDLSGMFVQVYLTLDYFNPNSGCYEPVLETIPLMYKYKQLGKSSDTVFQIVEAINLNVSVELGANIAMFQKLWGESAEIAAKNKKKLEEAKKQFGEQPTLTKTKSVARSRTTIAPSNDRFLLSHQTIRYKRKNLMQVQQNSLASPYALKNLTQGSVHISYVDKQGNDQNGNTNSKDNLSTKIMSLEDQKLVQRKNSQQAKSQWREGVSQSSVMDMFVNIVFDSPQTMLPVLRLNLNMNNSMQEHKIYKDETREPIVLHSKLQDNRRVLIVRTQNVILNRTQLIYKVRIFYAQLTENGNTEIIKLNQKEILEPNESLPLPDHEDPKIRDRVKIAIRPYQQLDEENKDTEQKWKYISPKIVWSQEFKLQKMKRAVEPNINVLWQHGKTYSILRKLKTDLPNAFDMVLLPPIIVVNNLPCRISVKLEGLQAPDGSSISDFGQSQSIKRKKSDQIKRKENELTLEKQEVRLLENIEKFKDFVTFTVDINQQSGLKFPKKGEIKLLPDCAQQGDFEIKMEDRLQKPFSIKCRVATEKAGLQVIFYCENLLICRTQQSLNFYYAKHRDRGLPLPINDDPDNKMIIFHNTSDLYACLEDDSIRGQHTFTANLKVGGAGNVGVFTIINQGTNRSFNFGYQSAIWSVSETEIISTKLIEIAPQFILCNETNDVIRFAQNMGPNQQVTRVEPKQRVPYHWENREQNQQLMFRVDQANDFDFSSPFPITNVGTVVVCCQHQTEQDIRQFYRVQKRQFNQSMLVVIEKTENPPYLVKNQISEKEQITIKFCQSEQEESKNFQVKCGENKPFSWTNFQQTDPKLKIQFFDAQNRQFNILPESESSAKQGLIEKINVKTMVGQEYQQSVSLSLDDLNEFHNINLQMPDAEDLVVVVSVYKDEKFKVIEFGAKISKILEQQQGQKPQKEDSQIIIEEESREQQSKKKTQHILEGKDKDLMCVEIAQINLSAINKGVEVFTLFMHDFHMRSATTDTDIVTEMYLGRFQIDNNSIYDTLYPVMMKPKCLMAEIEHNHLSMHAVEPVFQYYTHQRKNIPNVTYYEIMEWLLKEMDINLEYDHVFRITDWLFEFQERMSSSLATVCPIFKPAKKEEDDDLLENFKEQDVVTWRNEDVSKGDDSAVYFKSYKGSPISLELSLFKQTQTEAEEAQKKQEKTSASSKVIQNVTNMGIKLTSLRDAPIKLDALEIQNVYGNSTEVQTQLTAHYYDNIRSNILRVLGSSDLIGNPYKLIDNLGTGVKKFYYEPRNGFMEGPLQGGLGLLKGTGGVVMIAGASTLGSIGKIANTLNKGFIAMTLDKEYIRMKEIDEIKHAPTGVGSGLVEGAKGLGLGIWGGLSGFAVKPIEGAYQNGVTGFFVGMGVGTLGLVFKPVSGAIDLITKSTQGLEQSATGVPVCEANLQRMREPRPFYQEQNIVRSYDGLHALVYNMLRIKYKVLCPFLGAYKCGENQTDTDKMHIPANAEILVLTREEVFAVKKDEGVSVWKHKVDWQWKVADIQDAIFQEFKEMNFERQPIVTFMKKVIQRKLGVVGSEPPAVQKQFIFTSTEDYHHCQDNWIEIQRKLHAQTQTDQHRLNLLNSSHSSFK